MNKSSPITLIIADNHPIALRGLIGLLRCHADFKLVASCSSGAAALEAVRALRPDVAVLDLAMPDMDGLAVLSKVGKSGTRVLLFTATITDAQVLAAVACGARGIVLKGESVDSLVQGIRDVAAGRHRLPEHLLRQVADLQAERARFPVRREQVLTWRERQVTKLVSEGLSNKEVGRRLELSAGTVKVHLHRIYDKMGVANRTALAVLARGRAQRNV